MGRLLAIDYGKKRTGIAVTDTEQLIANALTTVATHECLKFLANYVKQEPVERFIVGEARDLQNREAESMEFIKPFIKQLKKHFPDIPVELVDERFTSKLALQAMIDGGMKKKQRQVKANVDKISATIILQSYMEQKRNGF